MVSIFAEFEPKQYWRRYEHLQAPVLLKSIFSSTLSLMKDGKLSSSLYHLTSDSLVKTDSMNVPRKFVYINWKLVDPFRQETSIGILYGFRLGDRDFFTDSSTTLDLWLENLKKIAIMSTFEEEFTIIKEIGKGSSSSVFLIEDRLTLKQYAAKCFEKKNLIKNVHILRNLIQEIKILYGLDHPNVIKMHYIYETPENLYMIMEYFPYGDLYTRIITMSEIDEDVFSRFAKSLLEVIEYLHSKNIMHRDIKLENIIMTHESFYTFKLIDFGLAYEGSEQQSDKCGSPGYIAPEVVKHAKYNNKADIFSAGVVLYTLCTGAHPFTAKNSDKILNNNINCIYTKQNKSKLKGVCKNFIMKMMNPLPEERPTAIELLEHPWISTQKRSSICSLPGNFSTHAGSIISDP